MRITILTFGSTGDVLPFVALGKKLMQNGHLVTILATTDSRELIERHGLRFFSAEVNTKAMLKTELGQRFLATQSNGLKTLNLWRQLVSTYASNLPQMYKTASQDADLIIFTLSTFGGHSVAEQKGIPSIITSFFPVTPTGDFPVFIVRNSLGRSLNRLSYRAFESLWVAFPAACGATLLGKSPVWSTIGLIPRRLRRGGFIFCSELWFWLETI